MIYPATLTVPGLLAQRAADDADRPFVVQADGTTRTYREVHRAALAWSAALAALGVTEDEPVLSMLPPSAASIETWCAIAYLGALETPINPAYRGELLRYVLTDSRARVAIVHARYADEILPALAAVASITTVVVVDAEPGDARVDGRTVLTVDQVWERGAAHGAIVPAEPAGHDIATLLYTSGTTGNSKGVLVPWRQLEQTTVNMLPDSDLSAEDCFYSPYPTYHVTWKAAVTAMARVGGRLLCRDRFSTDEFWSDVRAHGATTVVLLGAMVNFLYRQPEKPGDAANPLRNVIMVPVVPEVADFKRRFGVRVKGLWNMTEASTQLSSVDWDVTDTASCGKPTPGSDVRVVDDNDHPVGPGVVGELVIRTDRPWSLMAGYWHNPEATRDAWRNLWFHTGDYFRYDEEGNYYFVDRKKDAIRRRGENISSVEVEFAALELDDILECAAVGVESEWGEQEVMLFVVAKPGRSPAPADIDAFLRDRLAAFMRPKHIEVVESLPKTVTEKIRKVELRERGVTATTWTRADTRSQDVAPSPG